MKVHNRVVGISLSVILSSFVLVQEGVLEEITKKFQQFNLKRSNEKVYLHTDTDTYYSGDIIWIASRLFDAKEHLPSNLSKVVHVKLFNDDHVELYHKKIEMSKGFGNADILLSDSLSTGVYYLTAYTEWMKNFSQDFFFERKIYVVNDLMKTPDVVQRDKSEIDIQFFPEGGSLIELLSNRVGFKVIDDRGQGKDVKAVLTNDLNDTIRVVQTYKYGMGNFQLNPKPGRTYYLRLSHMDSVRSFELPKAKSDGINLQIANNKEDVVIKVQSTESFSRISNKLFYLSHCRGSVNFTAERVITDSLIRVPKNRLEPGINHITIFKEDGLPVLQRLVFIQPDNFSKFKISSKKKSYGRKEKVELKLDSKITENANVTISVHNRLPASSDNIISNLLMTSDLKGQIEDPAFYFQDTDSARQAADNLMLTQGWTRYVWSDIIGEVENNEFLFQPEDHGLIFKGSLIDVSSGKVVSDTLITASIVKGTPNLFFHELTGDRFSFPFVGIHGAQQVIVNIPGNDDFSRYKVLTPDEYEFAFQNVGHFPYNLEEQSKLVQIKNRDNEVVSNYIISRPEIYSKPEPKSLESSNLSQHFYTPDHQVQPADFVKLNDMKELILSLVRSAKVTRRKGKDNIYIWRSEPRSDREAIEFYDAPATGILNGIPVFNHDTLLNLDYQNIEMVSTYRQLTHGGYVLNGLFSVTTKDLSRLQKQTALPNSIIFDGLSLEREFYSPKYEADDWSIKKLPDLRHLLFWEPNLLIVEGSESTVSFYTSDVVGSFYVMVQGVTDSGTPLVSIDEISVESGI